MDSIKNLLKTLITCDVVDGTNGIYSYNDVRLEESSESFRRRLHSLYEQALLDIPLLSNDVKSGLVDIVRRYEAIQSTFDVPNESHLKAMNADIARGNDNQTLKIERDFVKMVCECVSLQKYYLNEFAEAIGCVSAEPQSSLVDKAKPAEVVSIDENLIKGVGGLSEYLGCGINTAQNIINSKILERTKIQYRTGKGWRFRKDKLAELLEKEPEIFKRVGKK